MQVGDIIISTRDQGPDPCQTTQPPQLFALTAAVAASGTLINDTYTIQLTALTNWGESLPSAPLSVALTGSNNAISISLSGPVGSNGTLRIYVTSLTQPSSGFLAVVNPSNPYILLSNLNLTPGTPSTQSRSYLPDSDGGFASAYTIYRWLNESLKAMARVTNGIQDVCGIASVSGQRRYVAPGQWLRFDQCFYDGWELDLGNKAETFRNRNLTANISISLMVDAQSDTTRIELYWTPSRTSGTSTTSGTLNATDANVAINAPTGWLLQDGFAQVGSEIISYSAQTPTQLQNIIRGWNGSVTPSTLTAPANVSELNIELNGYRMPATYSVGQSASTLGVPPGWEPFLKQYMLGMFRDAEQERQEASDLMKQATTGLESWVKSNKPVAGPRQCRMYGDYGIRGLVPGGLTGGIIIP